MACLFISIIIYVSNNFGVQSAFFMCCFSSLPSKDKRDASSNKDKKKELFITAVVLYINSRTPISYSFYLRLVFVL